jgi:hypothetical protein
MVMNKNSIAGTKGNIFAGFLVCAILVSSALAHEAQGTQNSAVASPSASSSDTSLPQKKASPYRSTVDSNHARDFYQSAWGADSFSVKLVESGLMVRFSYRVVNAEKAKPLNDKKFNPSLIDPKARVKLVIPTMEKVGQLRQTNTPEDGKMYWMVFSNKGEFVKRGDRVTVAIGKFHVDGLLVE